MSRGRSSSGRGSSSRGSSSRGSSSRSSSSYSSSSSSYSSPSYSSGSSDYSGGGYHHHYYYSGGSSDGGLLALGIFLIILGVSFAFLLSISIKTQMLFWVLLFSGGMIAGGIASIVAYAKGKVKKNSTTSSNVEKKNDNKNQGVSAGKIVALVFLIIIGAISLIIGSGKLIVNSRWDSVQATCVSNSYKYHYYYTTYTYKVDGINYENESNTGWDLKEEVGAIVEIYYLKSNPNEIDELLPNDPTGATTATVLGSIFVALGILLLVLEIRKNKKKKNGELANNKNLTENKLDDKLVCSYCGSKFYKRKHGNIDNCPNCGANLK